MDARRPRLVRQVVRACSIWSRLSIVVLAYVYWPSNKKRFEQAASAILDDDDRPWP